MNFNEKIKDILKNDNRIWDDNKTELNQTLLFELLDKIDEVIIGLLLDDEKARDKFFVKIKDVYVFKTNDFKFFMEENKINNSYTQYKNRIGLTDGRKFLKDTEDIVLEFPYKDCILEGGQSNDEGLDSYFEWQETKYKDKLDDNGNKIKVKGRLVKELSEEAKYIAKTSKRNEVFFNQILAKDEIDRLLDEKAFINWKRLSENGEEKITEFKRDENGILRENLIIKGNNLLALHSLKAEFKGQIKLIYIDPPYNTGNDSFKYNDKFNQSTWLTFMKNRIEIAKDLLTDDGVIFVQCDYNQDAYLKVLMDEIDGLTFGADIAVKSSTPSGIKTAHKEKKIIKQKDTILFYSKSKNIKLKPQYTRRINWDTHYSMMLKQNKDGKFIVVSLKEELIKEGILSDKNTLKDLDISNKDFKKFYLKNADVICQSAAHKNKEIDNISRNEYPDEVYIHTEDSIVKGYYYNGRQLQPLANGIESVLENKSIKKDLAILLCDFWNDIDFQNTQNEGGVSFPTGKKPEELLRRIIEMTTSKNDIVLDFHLGSATTCSVAHKMKRQYIGIEQMDYIEELSLERLKKVIDGENSGITQTVNWKGGGDFIYCELVKWNEEAKEFINNCKTIEELISLFDTLYEKYFLNYNLKIKEFKEHVIKEENFISLSLNEQKKMFLSMLDLNQMYVNRSEMSDSKFGIKPEYQKLTNKFYSDK